MKFSKEVKELARECDKVYGNEDGEGLHFNVLVTQRCPFECAHCLNDSGPTRSPRTFNVQDAESLVNMNDVVCEFFGADAQASFNLIGGEPTLYVDALRDVMSALAPHGKLEMTTNGWWLRSAASFVRTMAVLEEYIGEMAIRISNSPYHRTFRTRDDDVIQAMVGAQKHTAERVVPSCPMDSPLAQIIEPAIVADIGVLGKAYTTCPECGSKVSVNDTESECDTCGHMRETSDEYVALFGQACGRHRELFRYASMFLEAWKDCTTYVETQSGDCLATGRAGPDHNQCGGKGGMCYTSEKLFTVAPGGAIPDMCCSGVPIGTIAAGHVSEGVVAAIRRVQLVRLINKRFPTRGEWNHAGRHASYAACTNCNKSIYAVVNGRTCRSEVDDAIRYLKRYGKSRKKQ